jgi:F420-0:gamma-glutamyl ligase
MRTVGTKAMGIRTPIIREGDDLVEIVKSSLLDAQKYDGVSFNDNDIVGITEAVVARAQGNYATVEQIAADVRKKIPSGPVGVVFPILSRNRFSMLLKGIAMGADRVIVQLSYPADEVGNELVSRDMIYEKEIDPFSTPMTEAEFRSVFGNKTVHKFTGIDYIDYYKSLHPNIEIILGNDPRHILKYTKQVICGDVHSRNHTKNVLARAGADIVLGLDDFLSKPVLGSGFNEKFGLLGSNKASENHVKLFPRGCDEMVERIAQALKEATGKHFEVLIYGDGGFKDPVGGIWELADPVISPAFTPGLAGTPNEIKLKYIADNKFAQLKGEEARRAIVDEIKKKDASLYGKVESEGTTPRQLTDLLGSLCDLTSGSGDKGTPVVLIQGYFDNYAS